MSTNPSDRSPRVRLTRVYRFASAHRLYSAALSEEENRRVYGKCSNPKGHGHNYVLEVSVEGNPDPVTGLVLNVAALDRLVEKQILHPWDHKHLDQEVADFRGRMSTGENIVQMIWEKLAGSVPAGKLASIRLSETAQSFFEFTGGLS